MIGLTNDAGGQSPAIGKSPALPTATLLALVSLSAARFMMTMASLALVGLLLAVASDLAMAPADVALIVTAASLTAALASPLLQMAIGGWPLRRLVVMGLIAIALGYGLAGTARDGATLAACLAVAALGTAIVGPMASSAGAGLVAAERRGEALGLVLLGTTLATVVGIPLASLGGDLIGWRNVVMAIAAAALIVALAVFGSVPGADRDRRMTPQDLLRLFGDRRIASGIAVNFLHMAAQFATFTLIAVFTGAVYGIAPSAVPLVLLAFGLGGVAGTVMATRALRRLPAPSLVRGGLVSFCLVFVVLPLLPPGLAVAMTAAFVWALVSIGLIAPHQSYLIGLVPGSRNSVLALSVAAAGAGIAAGSALAGLLADSVGIGRLPWISAVIAGCALAAFVVSSRAARDATTSQHSRERV